MIFGADFETVVTVLYLASVGLLSIVYSILLVGCVVLLEPRVLASRVKSLVADSSRAVRRFVSARLLRRKTD